MMTIDFIFIITRALDSTLKMGNQMSASNDELLLYNAARDGKLEEVNELLSKGTGTGYRNEVS
jgi:hypothetical protein